MKMVAAARLGKQERTTVAARPFAETLQAGFLDKTKEVPVEGKKQLVLLVTSDKGLCGALNSTLVRPLQLELRRNAANVSVACIGVKGRNGLATSFRDSIRMHVSEFGKNPVTFMEAAYVTDKILNGTGGDRSQPDVIRLQFNQFLNMVQSKPTDSKFVSKNLFVSQPNLLAGYEFEGGLKDEEVLGDLYDFLICGATYGAIMENQAAELGMRMSSMENATKNCGEVLSGLRLVYNRQRQAAITTELTESEFFSFIVSFFFFFINNLLSQLFPVPSRSLRRKSKHKKSIFHSKKHGCGCVCRHNLSQQRWRACRMECFSLVFSCWLSCRRVSSGSSVASGNGLVAFSFSSPWLLRMDSSRSRSLDLVDSLASVVCRPVAGGPRHDSFLCR